MVSIIVPVYNCLPYLERCVNSLVAQSYENIEIILVDDGSSDDTGKLCDTLSMQHARVETYHKENGGTSDARNYGIEKAKGELLAFVDSDDAIEPDMISSMVEAMEKSKAMVVQIGRDEREESGLPREDICTIPGEETFMNSSDFMRELLMHKGDCSFCTKLVRKELFQDNLFPVGELNEDFHVLIKMLPKIEGILLLPKCGYHVYYRMNSNTRKTNRNDFSRVFGDNVRNAALAMEIVTTEYPDLTTVAKRFGLIQQLDYLMHIPISQMTKENELYRDICSELKKQRKEIQTNPYLTKKNRSYLRLLRRAPRLVRQLHYCTMVLRGKI